MELMKRELPLVTAALWENNWGRFVHEDIKRV
jgi:hypothetical protein